MWWECPRGGSEYPWRHPYDGGITVGCFLDVHGIQNVHNLSTALSAFCVQLWAAGSRQVRKDERRPVEQESESGCRVRSPGSTAAGRH
jgi:hypothetical protein